MAAEKFMREVAADVAVALGATYCCFTAALLLLYCCFTAAGSCCVAGAFGASAADILTVINMYTHTHTLTDTHTHTHIHTHIYICIYVCLYILTVISMWH